jgi:hemolysin activation/secretion protein
MPLKAFGGFSHRLSMGFDFKETETDLEFAGQNVFSSSVHAAQAALEYGGEAADAFGRSEFSVSGFFSPGHLTTRQRSEDYVRARPGTDPQYAYGTARFGRTWYLPKGLSLAHDARAQFSTNRLQSSEQLLLGGMHSVRGYDDRVVASDEGVQINVELRSPDFMLGRIAGKEQYENRLRLVLFCDYGWGYNKGRFPGEEKNVYLNSVGAGLRYRLGSHLRIRFDYGRALKSLKGGLSGSDHGRVHLGVVASF